MAKKLNIELSSSSEHPSSPRMQERLRIMEERTRFMILTDQQIQNKEEAEAERRKEDTL